MFPTTAWTTIRMAAGSDREALERLAERYRGPVLRFLERRGFGAQDAEDLCQEVFLRILSGQVLASADAAKGRFRSLVLSVVRHVLQDRARARAVPTVAGLDPAVDETEFDREWMLHLAGRAMARLRDEGSPQFAVLRDHLRGVPQERRQLWMARRRLDVLIRDELAFTCQSAEELEEELAHLRPFLRPAKNP